MGEITRNPSVEGHKMNCGRQLKIIPFLTAFLIIFPILANAGQYRVIRVVDGDTIVVDYQGKHEKIRLLCVNTPESVHPDKKQNISMGKTASRYQRARFDLIPMGLMRFC